MQQNRHFVVQGQMQAINSGATADSLRHKLKDRRDKSGMRGGRGADQVGQRDAGTSGVREGEALGSRSQAELELSRLLVEAAGARGEPGVGYEHRRDGRGGQVGEAEELGTALARLEDRQEERMMRPAEAGRRPAGGVQQLGALLKTGAPPNDATATARTPLPSLVQEQARLEGPHQTDSRSNY